MPEIVNEALLEMHFHSALVEKFSETYGAKFLKLLKPSPQQEAWIGFDQGWARTSLTSHELFQELKETIKNSSTSAKDFYFGFFLQFKIVDKMVRSSSLKPKLYTTPYYRSKLSLRVNPTTGLSQHETLLRLSQIKGASVNYACGMLFDIADIWEKPDFAKLRFVDIIASPKGWASSERHFIAFQSPDDPSPLWCSDPVRGRGMSLDEWAFKQEDRSPRRMTGKEVLKLINDSISAMRQSNTIRFNDLEAEYTACYVLPSAIDDRPVCPAYTQCVV